MVPRYSSILTALALAALVSAAPARAQDSRYNIYIGNTHSHSIFTKSHGAHNERLPDRDGYMYVDSAGVSHAKNTVLRDDWHEHQGLPADHFRIAREEGYDFYVVTDHSQEEGYHPTSRISAAWVTTKRQAEEATDADFVALVGYEHSENNGPGGRGHVNVINSDTYLNALEAGVDLPRLHRWLGEVQPNGEGSVVATFNHPDADEYGEWAVGDPAARDVITMLEVINSNRRVHYSGFVAALDHGWKVSPVAGNDNHGLSGIRSHTSRTYVLAERKTKEAILDAMANRRTYASLEGNIYARYTVNGETMGSTLEPAETFAFDISVHDPDTGEPGDRITKLDIVTDRGAVVQSYTPPAPAHSVQWSPAIRDAGNNYYFVRVWNEGGGDGGRANPEQPVAWLAPVWVAR